MNPGKNPKRGTVTERVFGKNPGNSIVLISIYFSAFGHGPKNSRIKVNCTLSVKMTKMNRIKLSIQLAMLYSTNNCGIFQTP